MLAFKKTNREAYANFLRAKYEAYTGATTVRSYPYYLLIDPADICQLRCTTCPTGMDNEQHRTRSSGTLFRESLAVMKPALFDAVIEEVGPYLFFLMLYNWGEPLLNKSIHEFIKKASTYNIVTEIHTNLSLELSKRRIDELLSSGLDSLVASIDGYSQEVYQIHRVGGDIELIKSNLEAMVAARDRLGLNTRIVYKMLVFAHNEHEIPAARQYCEEIGVWFSCEDAAVPDVNWMPKERRKKLSEDLAKKLEAPPNSLAEEQERVNALFPDRKGTNEFPKFCSWHYGYSVVTAGGPVAPCCATAKESDDFGRVSPGEISFADVWNNERFRHVRGALADTRPSESPGIETVCEPCRFPKFVQQLYSICDPGVLAAFHRQFGCTESTLDAGFRLLGQARYELDVHSQLLRGIFQPQMLATAGAGNECNVSAFVEFYERYLAAEPTALDASSRGENRDSDLELTTE